MNKAIGGDFPSFVKHEDFLQFIPLLTTAEFLNVVRSALNEIGEFEYEHDAAAMFCNLYNGAIDDLPNVQRLGLLEWMSSHQRPKILAVTLYMKHQGISPHF